MGVKILDREKPKRELNLRRCKMASEVAIRIGNFYSKPEEIVRPHFVEHWEGDDYAPSLVTLKTHVKTDNIKWYIREHLVFDHDIWTPDFLMGITKSGSISWSRIHFPNFIWSRNREMIDLFEKSPFGGKLGRNCEIHDSTRNYCWRGVPALYLSHSEDSLSFLAGVLASGYKKVYKGEVYACYNDGAIQWLKDFGIPIEHETTCWKRANISPIWPAIFSPLMPEGCREYWSNIHRAYGVKDYAAILWTIYVDSNYGRQRIPYLQARRTIFNNYRSERGIVDTLRKMRVDRGLVELDDRFRDCIHNWASNMYNEKGEKQ